MTTEVKSNKRSRGIRIALGAIFGTAAAIALIVTVSRFKAKDSAKPKPGQRYNLMGQPVGTDHKGFVVEKGKKIFVK